MMDEKDHKPLTPAAHHLFIDDDAAFSAEAKRLRHRRYVKCCGCAAALILIQAVVILVLVFTLFRVKDPLLKMNSVQIQGLERVSVATLGSGANLTVVADVSVKNPNVAAFKYGNSTTTIYYGGVAVGEGRNPAGVARAKRTVRMNVTVDLMMGKVMGVSRLGSDLASGFLPVSSYTRIDGRVRILNIIKKNVVVTMNCSMTVNTTSQSIQDQSCQRKVSM